MLAKRLQRAGFEVLAAVDGRAGIEMAKRHCPHLILMDLDLPEVDGWEATRRLKGNSLTSRIPIIALTAHAQPQELKRAVQSVCDHFETKPVMFGRLLGKIQSCLQEPGPAASSAAG